MKTLNGKITGEVDIKRFHFKGKIKVKCPDCKRNHTEDFEKYYINYPVVGKPTFAYFCCDCGKDWKIPLIIKSIDVIVDYDDTAITEQ